MLAFAMKWFAVLSLVPVLLSCSGAPRPAADRNAAGDRNAMLDAVTFYASFDDSLDADLARGGGRLRTRAGTLDNPAGFRFEDGYDAAVYGMRTARGFRRGA